MEDPIEVILQDRSTKFLQRHPENPLFTVFTGALLAGFYGLWTVFALPGFRKVPVRLKVPYLPSSAAQTANVMKVLAGRQGRLADLGSGDGRLVFAASSAGFQCTGFEINSILLAYSRGKARWKGILPSQARFVNDNFWKANLSAYSNVTVFLGPSVMMALEEKLLKELPDGACIVACRFPFTKWPSSHSEGSGLDQVWAYDVATVRKPAVSALPTTTQPNKLHQ